jgi:hypothetical protein
MILICVCLEYLFQLLLRGPLMVALLCQPPSILLLSYPILSCTIRSLALLVIRAAAMPRMLYVCTRAVSAFRGWSSQVSFNL